MLTRRTFLGALSLVPFSLKSSLGNFNPFSLQDYPDLKDLPESYYDQPPYSKCLIEAKNGKVACICRRPKLFKYQQDMLGKILPHVSKHWIRTSGDPDARPTFYKDQIKCLVTVQVDILCVQSKCGKKTYYNRINKSIEDLKRKYPKAVTIEQLLGVKFKDSRDSEVFTYAVLFCPKVIYSDYICTAGGIPVTIGAEGDNLLVTKD